MTRVLVTRPADEAETTVLALQARGHEAVPSPVLTIDPIESAPLPHDRIQAVAVTSINGARALGRLRIGRGLPVFAVGTRTAEVARAQGFQAVFSADGDALDLARLLAERCAPGAGPVLHIRGEVGRSLDSLGVEGLPPVLERTVYRSRPAMALSREAVAALKEGTVDAALFFSPLSAEVFVTLAARSEVVLALGTVRALCLSRAVAERLDPAMWAKVEVAARPTASSLLDLIDIDRPAR